MKKKNLRFAIYVIIVVVIFLPGFSKVQEIRAKNEKLEKEIALLKEENFKLGEEIERLDKDPTYLESVAREKMGVARKGEIVYKIVPEEE